MIDVNHKKNLGNHWKKLASTEKRQEIQKIIDMCGLDSHLDAELEPRINERDFELLTGGYLSGQVNFFLFLI